MCISSIKYAVHSKFFKCFIYIYLYKTNPMENYIIVLGMYLILMLFFKIFFSVATKGE